MITELAADECCLPARSSSRAVRFLGRSGRLAIQPQPGCVIELAFRDVLDGGLEGKQRVQAVECGMDPPPGCNAAEFVEGARRVDARRGEGPSESGPDIGQISQFAHDPSALQDSRQGEFEPMLQHGQIIGIDRARSKPDGANHGFSGRYRITRYIEFQRSTGLPGYAQGVFLPLQP